MQPGRPPGSSGRLRVKDVLLLGTIILPAFTAALQQQPYDEPSRRVSAGQQHEPGNRVQDTLYTGESNVHGYRDTYAYDEKIQNKNRNQVRKSNAQTPNNQRALATVPVAGANSAAQAAPAKRSPVTSAGTPSRHEARSLQEFEVEDIILLATVDGRLHARDRRTGVPRWEIGVDKPMVETIYHRHNKSTDENGLEQEDPLWIVEPSQDGSIYVYAPGSGFGMQKLGYTVKQLADMAPYASEGQPAVAYTADKKNTLYTVDAATGNIMKIFSSGGSITNDNRSCRRISPLEAGYEEDECEPIGTLTLGQTEYTIGIQDRNTGEQISTIKYFEWGPNKWDQGLVDKYTNTMDDKYIYSRYDGMVYGIDILRGKGKDRKKAAFHQKFPSPVVRVYDVVRPYGDPSGDASLVVLPQPVGPSLDGTTTIEERDYESVFVNCTESGSWYALSEANYPTVTQGAMRAKCQNDDMFVLPTLPMTPWQRERFAGVHLLSNGDSRPGRPGLIDAPPLAPVDGPNESIEDNMDLETGLRKPVLPVHQQPTPASSYAWLVLAIVGLVTFYAVWQGKLDLSQLLEMHKAKSGSVAISQSEMSASNPAGPLKVHTRQPSERVADLPTTPRVREHEPAKEIIFPHDASPGKAVNANAAANADDDDFEIVDGEEDQDGQAIARERTNSNANGDTPKAKKRATRGKRGGAKNRQKAEEKQAKWAEKQQVLQQPEIITVAASESPQMSGPLEINSLTIYTDKVIGQGSCGTSVFEGSFEGRDVAVKRMLSQYYELASQEVSFLQQSDDHPNVVRYFCQQKDSHFLYIAVELCQASLFEVWDAEKARTDARQQQLQALRLAIQQDVPRTLQQLAAGLYHLHNLRIIHRDIKPQNILVAYPKRGQASAGPRLVISDFGLGKNLPENVSTLIDPTGNAGTSGWKAPELISQPARSEPSHSHQGSSSNNVNSETNGTSTGVKRAADIFSLGCLFFWVLTNGVHPFEDDNGWTQLRELNIKRDHKKMGVLEQWSDAYEPMQLITSMLEHQPENRPTALQVLNHPFFWPPEKRLAFLCDCSDHFEREPRGTWDDYYTGDSEHLKLLEERAVEIIGPSLDFLAKLDRHFTDTLGKQRKYSGNRVLDLLRALRNKKNHYEDMPEDVKRRVGSLPGGYLAFWCNRFPRLLMACYQVIHECGIEKGDRFKGYFVLELG